MEGGEGEERGLRKERERIVSERKETKGNLVNNLKRRISNINTCLCLLFSFLKVLSSRLDSAVKRCSIEL